MVFQEAPYGDLGLSVPLTVITCASGGAADQTLHGQLQLLGPPPINDLVPTLKHSRPKPGKSRFFTGTIAGAHDTQSRCGGVQAGDVQYLVRVPEGGGVIRFGLEPSPGVNLMLV